MAVGLAEVGYRQCRARAAQAALSAGRVEEGGNLLSEGSLSSHSLPEATVAQAAATQRADSVEDLVATVGIVDLQPILKELTDSPW